MPNKQTNKQTKNLSGPLLWVLGACLCIGVLFCLQLPASLTPGVMTPISLTSAVAK